MAKLTEAQEHNLRAIREAGGTLHRRSFTFYVPGSDVPVRGLNMTAIKSLIKRGLVVYTWNPLGFGVYEAPL